MAEIEIGLGAVVGDKDLAVLERAHGARIDVDVGVHLLHRDLQAARFHQRADGGGREPLAEGGNNAAGNKEKLGFHARLLGPAILDRKHGDSANGIKRQDSTLPAPRWETVKRPI